MQSSHTCKDGLPEVVQRKGWDEGLRAKIETSKISRLEPPLESGVHKIGLARVKCDGGLPPVATVFLGES